MEAGDLGSVDEWLGLFRHATAEPNRKSIGEPIERRIVVVGGLADAPRRGARRECWLGSQCRSLRPLRSRDLRPPAQGPVVADVEVRDQGSVRPASWAPCVSAPGRGRGSGSRPRASPSRSGRSPSRSRWHRLRARSRGGSDAGAPPHPFRCRAAPCPRPRQPLTRLPPAGEPPGRAPAVPATAVCRGPGEEKPRRSGVARSKPPSRRSVRPTSLHTEPHVGSPRRLMAPRATGEALPPDGRRRSFSLRFRAFGERQVIKLGRPEDGWTLQMAERELGVVLRDVDLGTWRPSRPDPTQSAPAPAARVPAPPRPRAVSRTRRRARPARHQR